MRYKNEINFLKDEQKNNYDQINIILTSIKDLQNNQDIISKKVFLSLFSTFLYKYLYLSLKILWYVTHSHYNSIFVLKPLQMGKLRILVYSS